MRKYELRLLVRGVDWYLFFFLVVLIPLGFLAFMGAAIFTLIVKQNVRECFVMAICSLFCIVIEQQVWEIYFHFPHTILVDREKEYIYLRRIFGKPSAVPMREIREVKSRFSFAPMYYPAFMGYKKVNVPGSVLRGGFFVVSPFFKNRKELLDTILKYQRGRN